MIKSFQNPEGGRENNVKINYLEIIMSMFAPYQ